MKKIVVFIALLAAVAAVVSQIDFSFLSNYVPAFFNTQKITETPIIRDVSTYEERVVSESDSAPEKNETPDDTQTLREIPDHCFEMLKVHQKQYYSVLLSSVNTMQSKCVVDIKSADTLKQDISLAFNAILCDNPDIFWVDTVYSCTENSDNTATVCFNYFFDKQTRDNKLKELSALTEGFAPCEPLDIYKYLCSSVAISFDDDAFKDTSYSALIDKTASPDGIAAAYQLLCKQSNIEVIRIANLCRGQTEENKETEAAEN